MLNFIALSNCIECFQMNIQIFHCLHCEPKKLSYFYFCDIFGFCWPIQTIFFILTVRNDQRTYLE